MLTLEQPKYDLPAGFSEGTTTQVSLKIQTCPKTESMGIAEEEVKRQLSIEGVINIETDVYKRKNLVRHVT